MWARGRERLSVFLYPATTFALALTAWEAWVRLGDVSILVLPPPSDIAGQLGTIEEMWRDLWVTVQRAILGFLLAVGAGFLIAVGIVTFRPFERAVYPLLVATQVIPKIAIAPLFLVWFGFGGVSTILIVFLIAFFPIVINSTVGLRSIEIAELYLARSMGASWLGTFCRMRLPNALPSIFGGLKLGVLLSVTGAVVAEFISATSGIGHVIQAASGDLDIVRVFVAVGYLSAIGLGIFMLMELAERMAIPWHVSRRNRVAAARETTF